MCERGHQPNKYLKQNHIKGCEYTTDKMSAGFILFTVLHFQGPFSHMITHLKEVIEVMKLERKKPS